jgi:hypothetical protein
MAILFKNAKKEVQKQYNDLIGRGFQPTANADGSTYSWIHKDTGEVYKGLDPISGVDAENGYRLRNHRQQRLMSELASSNLVQPSTKKADTSVKLAEKKGEATTTETKPTDLVSADESSAAVKKFQDWSVPTLNPLKLPEFKGGTSAETTSNVVPTTKKGNDYEPSEYDPEKPNYTAPYIYARKGVNYGGKLTNTKIIGDRSDAEISWERKLGKTKAPFNIGVGIASDSKVIYPKNKKTDDGEFELRQNPDYIQDYYPGKNDAIVASVLPDVLSPNPGASQNRDIEEYKTPTGETGYRVKRPILEKTTHALYPIASALGEFAIGTGVSKAAAGILGKILPKTIGTIGKASRLFSKPVAKVATEVATETPGFTGPITNIATKELPAYIPRVGNVTSQTGQRLFSMGEKGLTELPSSNIVKSLPEHILPRTTARPMGAGMGRFDGTQLRLDLRNPNGTFFAKGGKLMPKMKKKGKC